MNNKDGLQHTIQSVLRQTFDDFEYIVIDGGSGDGSVQLINQYSERIDYWISELDSGIYAAMNKGISQAKGDFCLMLNSGDWLVEPDVLEKVFSIQPTADLLVGACQVSNRGVIVHTSWPSKHISLSSFYKRTIPHQSTFIKRELFEKYGYYKEIYRIHGDYEFWIRTIIFNHCSIQPIQIVVTDYNSEGVSSMERNTSLSETEVNSILKTFIPQRILIDYEMWEKEREEMKTLYWVKSKPIFYALLLYIFKVAQKVSQLRKQT